MVQFSYFSLFVFGEKGSNFPAFWQIVKCIEYKIISKVLEEVPEDNCRFLEESGLKIFMAGLVRFYHIEV